MATVTERPSPTWTLSRLRRYFGMIPAERILMKPAPGTATEKDLLRINNSGEHLCELVDSVLVEKAVGAKESFLACLIIHIINTYLDHHRHGIVLGADGLMRLVPGLVRPPDVSFISWDRLPGGELSDEPIPSLVPNLAIEVISKSNTRKEMERKLEEYFTTGVQLAWLVYPKKRTVEVYTSPTQKTVLGNSATLDGGDLLPGFSLPLATLFAPPRRPAR
jgi:Uma2 family endonuclease